MLEFKCSGIMKVYVELKAGIDEGYCIPFNFEFEFT